MADGLNTTMGLLARAREGDHTALDQLAGRFLPRLRRWASGRLPRRARDLLDTEDIVQDTLWRTVRRLGQFEPRHDAALEVYLREAVANRLCDEFRRAGRLPAVVDLADSLPDHGASPLESLVGRDALARYENALQRLSQVDREAIVGRLELGYSYEEVALLIQKPNANAARQAVLRAVVRLADEMRHERR